MRTYFILVTVLILTQVCFGQKTDKESIVYLSDPIIRNEIATFNIKGSGLEKMDSKSELIEIPLRNCTGSKVDFSKGSTYIDIYFKAFDTLAHKLTYQNQQERRLILINNNPFWGTKGEIPTTKIDSIFLVVHSHYWIKFPDSAFTGIFEPNSCNIDTKGKKLMSSNYKAFQSKDKRRIYIYMINGKNENRYEVTWVIQDSKYYTRIVDSIQN